MRGRPNLDVLPNTDVLRVEITDRWAPPGWPHLLGTDRLEHDQHGLAPVGLSVQIEVHAFGEQRDDGCALRLCGEHFAPDGIVVAVDAKGERFGNEASVHFVEAMHKSGTVPAHIIGDAAFIKKYGMGMVYPGGGGLKKLIAAGCSPSLSRSQ